MGMYKMKYGTSRKAVYFMYGLFGVTFQYTCYLAATGMFEIKHNISLFNQIMLLAVVVGLLND